MTKKAAGQTLMSDEEFERKHRAAIPAEVKVVMKRLAEEDAKKAAASRDHSRRSIGPALSLPSSGRRTRSALIPRSS